MVPETPPKFLPNNATPLTDSQIERRVAHFSGVDLCTLKAGLKTNLFCFRYLRRWAACQELSYVQRIPEATPTERLNHIARLYGYSPITVKKFWTDHRQCFREFSCEE